MSADLGARVRPAEAKPKINLKFAGSPEKPLLPPESRDAEASLPQQPILWLDFFAPRGHLACIAHGATTRVSAA
ncbi:hypothetical protein IHQ68_02640 [Chelatococcus sambhunathii]|uniref:Uncharacterized protein n=1 Tax=Chelatococcus sambhunathii TaxID=363953 RepID=A0ABU1DBM9_9HYPH|nr:hypothetical protein [Chelatococcus sambhunathii]MDR4305520.1 hypothetical protein [Chelatococcus sambhunathii]